MKGDQRISGKTVVLVVVGALIAAFWFVPYRGGDDTSARTRFKPWEPMK